MPTDIDELAELIGHARRMPSAMLPRPRLDEPRTIDLTWHEVEIPATTLSLVDGYDDYGT